MTTRTTSASERSHTPRRRPEGLAPHAILLAGLSTAALAGCLKVGQDVIAHESGAFDDAVRAWVLAHQRPRVRRAYLVATEVGAPAALIPSAVAVAAWLWRARERPIAAAMITAPAVASGIFVAVKQGYARPRPPGGAPMGEHTYSFPSGHATTSAAVIGILAYVLWRERILSGRAAASLAAGVPLIVGTSRVYLDVHWATDVLGGWSAGALVAALSAVIYERTRRDTREHGTREDSRDRPRRTVRHASA